MAADPVHRSIFKIAPGVVVDVEFHALIAPPEQGRFLNELWTVQNGKCPLGRTIDEVLTGVALDPGTPFPPDLPTALSLAVSPSSLRLETAQLVLPEPDDAYWKLSVLPQGGKVSCGVIQNRDPKIYNFIHDVIVQEQIWRWNGKPVLPEDFAANGAADIMLPTPAIFNDPAYNDPGYDPAKRKSHFAWDGIGFHARENNEHLATVTRLPLARPFNEDGTPSTDVDILYTDDKSADARALYFRFSAIMRSRYFGAWPGAVQAGERQSVRGIAAQVAPLWKRCTLPHRLSAPLKKPSIVIIIPLLASGLPHPLAGDSAGVLAIVREAAFEQGGLAELLECELVQSDAYQPSATTALVEPDGRCFFQAGYDPILSTAALASHDRANETIRPPLRMSGPVGLTFDQGSRDPLIVNSLFYIDVRRDLLSPLISAPAPLLSHAPAPAAHLFAQIRFRRTIRWDYDAVAPPDTSKAHPLASEWTESQWVKFLPDSDLLRPDDDSGTWRVAVATDKSLFLNNWTSPQPWEGLPEDSFRTNAYVYLLCLTRHDLDAVGRPAVRFHSLYKIVRDTSAGVTQLLPITLAPGENAISTTSLPTLPSLRGRIIEALRFAQYEVKTEEDWYTDFMPPPHAGVTKAAGPISEDATLRAESISQAYPVQIA